MKKKFIFYPIFFLVIVSTGYNLLANVQLNVNFPENQNCVAYKVNKSMGFEDSIDVIGLNCNIEVSKKIENGKVLITSTIPLNKFDSGEKGRDKHVIGYLGGKKRPDLLFISKPYASNEFDTLLKGQNSVLSGDLFIGENKFPVEITLIKNKNMITGTLITTLSYFEIEPPKAGPFGIIAKVKDYLELHLQVNINSL